MLIRCFGGEIPEEDRAQDSDLVICIQYVNRVLHRVTETSGEDQSNEFHAAMSDGRGIASALDAMTWADGMNIYGSDEVMCQLFDAMRDCVTCALKFLYLPGDIAAPLPSPTNEVAPKVRSTIKSTKQRTSAPAPV